MNKLATNIIILFIFVFVFFVSYAGQQISINHAVKAFIHSWQQQQQVPAIALTIYTPNNGYHSFYSGYLTYKNDKHISSDTLFQIGSITKTFISIAILQQIQKNKISFGSKIGKWFPQFPRWKNVTIKQLLNMSSGIFRYMHDKGYMRAYNKNPTHLWHPIQLINIAY